MITKPKGTYDLVNIDAKLYDYISNCIADFMACYNYEFIRTPIFEASELFHRSVGESSDMVTKETYDFVDRGGRNITLRPEGTAGVVRALIENKLYGNRNDVLKYYYLGTMYRYERPQAGRFRELTQFGVEVFNSDDVLIDAEVISLGYNLIKELGFDNFTVHLNTLGDEETRNNYIKALKEYLKPYINDLCDDCKIRYEKNPLRILDCKIDQDSQVFKNMPNILDYLSLDAKVRFEKLKNLLTLMDIDYEIDSKLVRGIDYYDYHVWEYIDDETHLALGAGGRYNKLVKMLDGPDMPAIGFGLGIDRIMAVLKQKLEGKEVLQNIDAYIMCVNEEEKIYAARLAQDLRLNHLCCELNSNNLSMKSQFKVADNLHSKLLIILNSDDLAKGLINVKDNATKEEVKIDENEIIDYIISNI